MTMRDDELDRILVEHDRIVPSERFTESVMTAVAREVSRPAPIPFPWSRAIPGLVALAVLASASPMIQRPAAGAIDPTLDFLREIAHYIDVLAMLHAGSIGLALLIAFASSQLAARLVAHQQ
jgi:hypothetical protein